MAYKTQLTSLRIPEKTLEALKRRAKRKDMSQNAFIVAALNKSLGLGTRGFDPNPPLPTKRRSPTCPQQNPAIAPYFFRALQLEYLYTDALPC